MGGPILPTHVLPSNTSSISLPSMVTDIMAGAFMRASTSDEVYTNLINVSLGDSVGHFVILLSYDWSDVVALKSNTILAKCIFCYYVDAFTLY